MILCFLGTMMLSYKGETDVTLIKKMLTIWRLCRWPKYPPTLVAQLNTMWTTMRRTPCVTYLTTGIGTVRNPVNEKVSARTEDEPFKCAGVPWNARTLNASTKKSTSLQIRLTLIAQTNVYIANMKVQG